MSMTLDRPVTLLSEEGMELERLWTREEFHRAANLGLFGPEERLELIGGRIFKKMTQNPPHSIALGKVSRTLARVFGPDFYILHQQPVVLSTDGESEPDVAVVPGSPDDYPDHPTQADVRLLVEISDATLRFDRGRKSALYAEAGIGEYWILNLNDRQLEVRRDPGPHLTNPRRFVCRDETTLGEADTVTPLAVPNAVVRVVDLLPRLSTPPVTSSDRNAA
jgi:Uma2 family endonuclease